MTPQQAQLLNWLVEQNRQLTARVEKMQADIELAGSIATDLKLIAVANGGPLDKQVEQIILKGHTNGS
jgi:hypothetical protein